MEELDNNLFSNWEINEWTVINVFDFEVVSPIESAMRIMPQHILIIVILIIISYFLFWRKDKTTFRIAWLSLLFYVIWYNIINAFIWSMIIDLTVYLHPIFEIKLNNILYFNSVIAWIITICLNIILLLPIRIYSKHLKLNIDYKKLFLLFSTYLIISSLYGLLYIQLYFWGFIEQTYEYNFSNTWLFVIFLALAWILPGIISYKIAFYDKVKK